MSSSAHEKRSTGLIAVLLITRSRPGPKLVFHYPAVPHIASGIRHGAAQDGTKEHDSDIDSEAEGSELDGSKQRRRRNDDHQRAGDVANDGLASSDADYYPDKKVLGYSVDSLEKLLSPGKCSDRKRFEVCLDGVTFVGHPVHAGEDGRWSEKSACEAVDRTAKANGDDDVAAPASNGDAEDDEENEDAQQTANITITAPETLARGGPHDFTHVPESFDSQLGTSLATSMASTSTASGAVAEELGMFHVVFALSGDHQQEASEIYEHGAKTLSKALRYCQRQSNYVAVESRKLLALKGRAKASKMGAEALWTQMVEGSELAWALKELYEKLPVGEVAGVRLNGMEISLQLPPTSTPLEANDVSEETLSPLSALLLLEDKDVLLHELQHPDASPLACFIREHTPTKSLQKLSNTLNLRLPELLYLSQHLIKWRKARPIPPLHPRNTYVVLPTAPVEKVPELTQVYGKKFAALPPLPQMLKVLSGKPIRYGLFIPSKDHRAPYMDILAFLHRHGLVGQLRTFGWLRACPGAAKKAGSGRAEQREKRPVSGVSLLSPHLRPTVADDDAVSVSSGRSAVTVQTALPATEQPSEEGLPTSIMIVDPADPVGDEVAALEQIQASILDEELAQAFPRLLPHLDGEHAFEDIAAKEGWKRARVEEWLEWLERDGCLMTFRAP